MQKVRQECENVKGIGPPSKPESELSNSYDEHHFDLLRGGTRRTTNINVLLSCHSVGFSEGRNFSHPSEKTTPTPTPICTSTVPYRTVGVLPQRLKSARTPTYDSL